MNSSFVENPGNLDLPREFDNDTLYQPKSARLYCSPYLYPPFSPKPPDNKVFSRRATPRSPRSPRNISSGSGAVSQRFSLATPYKRTRYIPPTVDVSYVDRFKYLEQKNREHIRRIVRKYKKKEQLPVYNYSFKNTYDKIVLGKQNERIMKEEYDHRTAALSKRKRAMRNFKEAEKAHEEIMKKTGVQKPRYNL